MIKDNVARILKELPPRVVLVAATKNRSVDEIKEATRAGIAAIGENYIQEAQVKFNQIGNSGVRWHAIGHIQKNKIKKAAAIFDMIETIDDSETAAILDKECQKFNKIMDVLIEVNCGCEPNKNGIVPDGVEPFLKEIINFKYLKIRGLMTMGPFVVDYEDIRPFFRKTKEKFDTIAEKYKGILDWKYLSMGMSDTYKIAIEEGANIIRVGTAIFGPRENADGRRLEDADDHR